MPSLDHVMHLALERLLAAWQPLRQLHVAELLQQVEDATSTHPPGDASWVGQLALPALPADRLVAAVELAIDDGRATGLAEAEAQAAALRERAEAAPRPDHAARLQAYAEGAERLLAGGLVQSASREAFRLTATTGDVDIPGHVETILGELPMLAERDVLAGMGTGAVNEGRYEVADAIMGERSSQLEAAEAQHAVYALEILDGNTCEPCGAIDGQEYHSLAEARVDYPGVGGGYVGCLGRERCRGSLVIVYDTEAPPTQTEPATPGPLPRPGPRPPIEPPPAPPTPPPAPTPPEPPARPAGQTPNEFGVITPSPGRLDEFGPAMRNNGELLLSTYRRLVREEDERLKTPEEIAQSITQRPEILRGHFRATLQQHGIEMAELGDLRARPGRIKRDAPPLNDTVDAAGTLFPADWVEASNNYPARMVYNDLGWDKRAFFDPGNASINLGSGDEIAVAAHEIVHRMEAAIGSDLIREEHKWLLSRRKPGEQAVNVPGYGKDEKFMLDELPSPYTGKIYSASGTVEERALFYEVLSEGIQALAGGAGSRMFNIRADTSHMQFVFGILSTLRPIP